MKRLKKVVAVFMILAMCMGSLSGMTMTNLAASKEVTAITLNTKSKSLTVGQTYQLKVDEVTPKGADKGVIWKSSNSKVAMVSSNGKVTAKKSGNATIRAISKENNKVKGTCKIKVFKKVKKVLIYKNRTRIGRGGQIKLRAEVRPYAANQKVTWSSSDSSIAKVNSKGVVTGRKLGKVTITAKSIADKKITAKCEVRVVKWCLPPTIPATITPTKKPTKVPTKKPTKVPTKVPTKKPTQVPKQIAGPRIGADNSVTYDCIYFGNYPQSDGTGEKKDPILWRVLSVKGQDAFLVADNNLDTYPYNETDVEVTWENCSMRSWLNGYSGEANICGKDYSENNFIDRAFSDKEQEAILQTEVINEAIPGFKSYGGNNTVDKIFLLSYDEITNPDYGFLPKGENDDMIEDLARIRMDTNYVIAGGTMGSSYVIGSPGDFIHDVWWLRTPGSDNARALAVQGSGSLDITGSSVMGCISRGNDYSHRWPSQVCPVLHLDLSKKGMWQYGGTLIYRVSTVKSTVTSKGAANIEKKISFTDEGNEMAEVNEKTICIPVTEAVPTQMESVTPTVNPEGEPTLEVSAAITTEVEMTPEPGMDTDVNEEDIETEE